jgi:hypothetical protein
MNLFEMRKERQLAINAADAILEHARKANREITKQEAEIIDEHCTTAKQLSEKIRPIEEKIHS